MVELIRNKQAGLPERRAPASAAPRRNSNIMEALRQSLELEKNGLKKPVPANKNRKRDAGQTEMLLPIAGKKEPSSKVVELSPRARSKKAG